MPEKPEVVFDDDNPEWTEDDFARARPISDFPELEAAFARAQNSQRAREAEQVTLHVDKIVLDRFRASGPDWENQINEALRAAIALSDASARNAA